MTIKKLLIKIENNQKNVRFNDFTILLEAFGFGQMRKRGSHRIYEHPNIPAMVNAQNENGQAKPYQIKQFLAIIETYNLKLEGE